MLTKRIMTVLILIAALIDLFLYICYGLKYTFSQQLHTAFFSTFLASFYVGHLCGHWLMRDTDEPQNANHWVGFLIIFIGIASLFLYFGFDINIMIRVPPSFTLYHPVIPFVFGAVVGALTFPMPKQ